MVSVLAVWYCGVCVLSVPVTCLGSPVPHPKPPKTSGKLASLMTNHRCVHGCCCCCFSLSLCVCSINRQLIQGVTHLHPETAGIDSSRVMEIGRMDIKEPAGQDWQINTLLDQQCFPALPFLPHHIQKIKPPAPTASVCGTSVAITV